MSENFSRGVITPLEVAKLTGPVKSPSHNQFSLMHLRRCEKSLGMYCRARPFSNQGFGGLFQTHHWWVWFFHREIEDSEMKIYCKLVPALELSQNSWEFQYSSDFPYPFPNNPPRRTGAGRTWTIGTDLSSGQGELARSLLLTLVGSRYMYGRNS